MRRLLALLLTAMLALAACGDDGASTSTSGTGDGGGDAPERIVSLSPTATEVLYAIGAGPAVVAVDDQSSYPPEAPVTDLSGYTPNVEAIVAYRPDLVVISTDAGGLTASLAALGITTILQEPAKTLAEAYDQITELGAATGHTAGAADTVAAMQAAIDATLAEYTAPAVPVTFFYELDTTLYSLSSNTFVGEMFTLLGLTNIADEADDGSGYPQLSTEYVLRQNPDFIFLADAKCCGENATTVGARPGWNTLRAVTMGNIVEIDDDIASRWGPRAPELFATIAESVSRMVRS